MKLKDKEIKRDVGGEVALSYPQNFQGEIITHSIESPRYRRLQLKAPEVARSARAGQFIHVLPRDAASFDPLLRRAFSIMSTNGDTLTVLYRIEGRGTALLSTRQVGEYVDFLGPLGKPFADPPQRAILVGGGVGVPPLLMLARQVRQSPGQDDGATTLTMLLGARSREDVLCLDDFGRLQIGVEVATDDGSVGEHGRVTQLLQRHLALLSETETLVDEGGFCAGVTVYACGPILMLKAVAALCAQHHVRCQVSLEENMPCGVGVCNGCVVPVAEPQNEYSMYRRICVDGPVMWAHELSW